MHDGLDFERIFRGLPGSFAVLQPDANFTILVCSDGYYAATRRTPESLIGRGILEAFRAPGASQAATLSSLRASLERVMATRASHQMPIQRYDLPGTVGTEEHYWRPENAPVLSPDGEVRYIIHRVEDVTAVVKEARAQQDVVAVRATEILE